MAGASTVPYNDALQAYNTCLSHLSPGEKTISGGGEAKVDFAKELAPLGVDFGEKPLSDLAKHINNWKTGKNILYVGGTNRSDPAKREEEHEKINSPELKFFYYCPVKNVKEKETYLLELRPEILQKNIHTKSNCKPEGGFVYVLDTGLKQLQG